MTRRLVITVCPREPGVVTLPVERSGRMVRMDAGAITRHLEEMIARRRLGESVQIQHGCAGGCSGAGPNVSVTIFPMTRPGEKADHVAIGWRSYVASIATLDCVASIVEENLERGTKPARSRRVASGSLRRPPKSGSRATRRNRDRERR